VRRRLWAIDGPILIMLATLIPVSDALRTSGGTDLIAQWLTQVAYQLPPFRALTLILVAAMRHPVPEQCGNRAGDGTDCHELRRHYWLQPGGLLMAVALGAGCDFLTPIRHQCNTLVMGPGGYRFSPRLGLPLSVIIVLTAVPELILFWPLT